MRTRQADRYRWDPAAFIDDFIPLNEKGKRWNLSAHQRKVLALAFSPDVSAERRLRLRLLLWGEMKKSGKTLLAAGLTLWWAYTRQSTEVIVAQRPRAERRACLQDVRGSHQAQPATQALGQGEGGHDRAE